MNWSLIGHTDQHCSHAVIDSRLRVTASILVSSGGNDEIQNSGAD